MKTYVKPGVALIDLLQEERIAAFYWEWTGVTPDAEKVQQQYLKFLEDKGITPFSVTWECAFKVVS